jgi:hypothetical protein
MIRKLITSVAAAAVAAGSASAFGQSQYGQYVPQQQPQQQQSMVTQTAQPAVQQVQGQIFTYPVPQGWHCIGETTNEVFINAPDNSMAIGFMGLERVQVGNSMQFMHQAFGLYGCQNLQVLGGNRLPAPNCDAIEATVTYVVQGMARKAWVRVAVVQQNGFGNGYMLIAAAAPEKFDGVINSLKPLCDRIQITNATLAFDRQRAMANQQAAFANSGASLNHPMDDTVTKGYWDRQKTMDDISARRSDVMLDSYRSTDTTTGTVYAHGQDAYDPTRGGVVNPERPTEILTPEQQWQGR